MKILVLHQFYLAPGEPGGSRFNELAALWAEQGHAVTVVAGSLNYASGRRAPGTDGRWTVRWRDGDVDVIWCHVPSSYNGGAVGRMWALLVSTLSSAIGVLRASRPDVLIATSPPLTIAMPALLAAKLRFSRLPWVFEVRDLWPESAITTGVLSSDSVLARLLFRLEKIAYETATRINVLTPAFRDNIVTRGLAANDKISFVPNGADVDVFSPGPRSNEARREFGWGNDFVALYAGAHGRANALMQLLDAGERLRQRPDIRIVSVGDGPERRGLIEAAAARGLRNVSFIGSQPKSKMPSILRAADAGMAVLQANPTFRTVYPNKVFDYMACARPTVLAIDGIARTLVCEEARAGLFAEPENGVAIAAAIERLQAEPSLAANLGANGRAWVVEHASRTALARRYLTELQTCIRAQT